MSNQFLGEIRIFAGNFAINQWALCQGQLLQIRQYTALFSLLGTTYGGNGTTTFGLPNLQGIAPMQQGQGPGLTDRSLGGSGGEPTVLLTQSTMPGHNHAIWATTGLKAGLTNTPGPTASLGSGAPSEVVYGPATGGSNMNAQGMAPQGGNQPHNNIQPYQVLNFIIALSGIFPQRP
jgi:microcystin-dependent protein